MYIGATECKERLPNGSGVSREAPAPFCEGPGGKFPWSTHHNLHWVADVVFREDDASNKAGYSAENLTLIRRLVMNMVNLFDPSTGLAAARRFATHEPEYLKGILIKVFTEPVKFF